MEWIKNKYPIYIFLVFKTEKLLLKIIQKAISKRRVWNEIYDLMWKNCMKGKLKTLDLLQKNKISIRML